MSSRRRLLLESAVTACVGALAVFALLSLLHTQIDRPGVHRHDVALQMRIHAWSTPALTRVMHALTWIGSIKVFIPTLLCALVALLLTGEQQGGRRTIRKREIAALFLLAIGGALVLNDSTKRFFHRPRPLLPWSIRDEHTWSFPSGHSLFSAVLYGLIAYILLNRRRTPLRLGLSAAALAMPFGIGLSRIYLGEHFPTDVLAGWTTGAVWLATTIIVDQRWQAHTLRTHGHDAL